MYTGQVAVISNKATWWSDVVELYDEDDDGKETVIDLSDPNVVVDIQIYINDQDGCSKASATLQNGKAEIVGPGFQWSFADSDLAGICAGTYHCIVRLTIDGFIADLVLGTIAVLEGR
jgi:hypothetical protein